MYKVWIFGQYQLNNLLQILEKIVNCVQQEIVPIIENLFDCIRIIMIFLHEIWFSCIEIWKNVIL